MTASNVVLYSMNNCANCKKAKMLLESKGYTIDVRSIDEDVDAMRFISEGGYRSMPQIFIGETHIGGYNDLLKYLD
jgi:glutaredoxin 3